MCFTHCIMEQQWLKYFSGSSSSSVRSSYSSSRSRLSSSRHVKSCGCNRRQNLNYKPCGDVPPSHSAANARAEGIFSITCMWTQCVVSFLIDVIQNNHNDFLYFFILRDQTQTALDCCSRQDVRTCQSKAATKATSECVWVMCERRGISHFPVLISMRSRIFFLRSRATAGGEHDGAHFALCAGAILWIRCWLSQADSSLLSTRLIYCGELCLIYCLTIDYLYTGFCFIFAQWMSGIWSKVMFMNISIFNWLIIDIFILKSCLFFECVSTLCD